jgi:hypothetical protein
LEEKGRWGGLCQVLTGREGVTFSSGSWFCRKMRFWAPPTLSPKWVHQPYPGILAMTYQYAPSILV